MTGSYLMRAWLAAAGVALGAGVAAVAFAATTVPPKPITGTPADQPAQSSPHDPPEWGFFDHYCGKCHNSTDWAGNIAFDTMSPGDIGGADAKTWEEAVSKLQGRLMPPPDKPQPDQAQVDKIVSFLEGHLDAAAAAHPNPGQVVLHRLNRSEYAHEIQDILGIKVDATALLPAEIKTDGFDNVATSLRVSPSFLDQYIDAAHDVTAEAIGNPQAAMASVQVRAAAGTNQEEHIQGLPLGTRGGMLATHLFPSDGDYVFNINQSAGFGGGYIAGLDSPQHLIMTVDGQKVYETQTGGEEDLKNVDQKQADAVKVIRKRF